jgi:hypothetical protein
MSLDELCRGVEGPLSWTAHRLPTVIPVEFRPMVAELAPLLDCCDGFYAFNRALHVFPIGGPASGLDLIQWNEAALWRNDFGDLTEGMFFFAEDVFGAQFALHRGEIVRFSPETALHEHFAPDLTTWAERVISDPDSTVGRAVAGWWERNERPIPFGKRLLPKVPLTDAGAHDPANLVECNAVEGMRYRAYIATRLKDLPRGTKVSQGSED